MTSTAFLKRCVRGCENKPGGNCIQNTERDQKVAPFFRTSNHMETLRKAKKWNRKRGPLFGTGRGPEISLCCKKKPFTSGKKKRASGAKKWNRKRGPLFGTGRGPEISLCCKKKPFTSSKKKRASGANYWLGPQMKNEIPMRYR